MILEACFTLNNTMESCTSIFKIKVSGDITLNSAKLTDYNGIPFEELSKKSQKEVIKKMIANHLANNIPNESIRLSVKHFEEDTASEKS